MNRYVKGTIVLVYVFLCSSVSFSQTYLISNPGAVTTCSGNFYDDGGASGNYGTNKKYIKTFCPQDTSKCLEFNFSSIDLNIGATLTIYNGPDTNSSILRIYNFQNTPATIVISANKYSIPNSRGCVTFKFEESSGFFADPGWAASIACVTCKPPPVPTVQDACGAIPICKNVYSSTTAYSGSGNYPSEINPGSCLTSGETNSVWYTFTVQQSGLLRFTLTPNAATDDYDWGVYNITNASCSEVYQKSSLLKSCNSYGDCPNGNCGATGISSANGGTSNSSGPGNTNGPAWNKDLPVTAGETYLVSVINFTGSANGYTINFGTSTAVIFDNIPPLLDSITSLAACGTNKISLVFSENILCSTVQAGDFTLTGPGGPYSITNISSLCAGGADHDRYFTLDVSPPITQSGTYYLKLVSASGSVTDLCGNVSPVDSLKITVNSLSINTSVVTPACGQQNGSVTVTTTGGVPPYKYSWSPVTGTNNTISNISAGVYTVTVTDSKGCSQTTAVTVGSSGSTIALSMSATNISCAGLKDGSATVSGSGGTVPFSYVWNTVPVQNAATATGLSTGTYVVTLTDSKGCTGTATVSITQPPAITSSVSVTNTACGANAGSASVSANGGNGGFNYSWNPGGQNTSAISNLAAGTYTCTIADANGCTQIQTATILNTNGPVANVTLQADVSCNGGKDGSASSAATGGTPPYSFSWSNGQAAQNASGLSAGTYTLTVTDAAGCSDTKTILIAQPTAITASVTTTQASCSQSDGSATANPSGGTSPYSYLWNTMQSGKTITGLAAASYTVVVTDARGCSKSFSTIVTNASVPIVIAGTNATILAGGSANLSASGGVSYSWSPALGLSCVSCPNPVASPGQTTHYCVVVTDANKCADSACVTISVEVPCINSYYLPNAFSPNGDSENDELKVYFGNLACVKEYKLAIYNRWGEKIFESEDPAEAWDGNRGDNDMGTQVVAYCLHIVFTDGSKVDKRGNVSLLR